MAHKLLCGPAPPPLRLHVALPLAPGDLTEFPSYSTAMENCFHLNLLAPSNHSNRVQPGQPQNWAPDSICCPPLQVGVAMGPFEAISAPVPSPPPSHLCYNLQLQFKAISSRQPSFILYSKSGPLVLISQHTFHFSFRALKKLGHALLLRDYFPGFVSVTSTREGTMLAAGVDHRSGVEQHMGGDPYIFTEGNKENPENTAMAYHLTCVLPIRGWNREGRATLVLCRIREIHVVRICRSARDCILATTENMIYIQINDAQVSNKCSLRGNIP